MNGTELDLSARGSRGEGWSYSKPTLTVTGDVVISGTNTSGNVVIIVGRNSSPKITVSNLMLRAKSRGQCSFSLTPSSSASLVLAGTNSLESVTGRAGIEVPAGCTLSITNAPGLGEGTITAIGGNYAAGIGGAYDMACGTVKIQGGVVNAHGGMFGGAGIGGGYGGNGGRVEVSGGIVTAEGGSGVEGSSTLGAGSGIGPGFGGRPGVVDVSGGTIRPMAGQGQTGNGGDVSGKVTVSGGSIDSPNLDCTAPQSSEKLLMVTASDLPPNTLVRLRNLGSYGTNDMYTDESGTVYLWLSSSVFNPETDSIYDYLVIGDQAESVAEEPQAIIPPTPIITSVNVVDKKFEITITNAVPGALYQLIGASNGSEPFVPEGKTVTATSAILTLSTPVRGTPRLYRVNAKRP